jgi:hypothetical protein
MDSNATRKNPDLLFAHRRRRAVLVLAHVYQQAAAHYVGK